jgi:acetate kinase
LKFDIKTEVTMNIFVINSGSSSIKYQLIRMPGDTIVCSGLVDRIGLPGSTITHKIFNESKELVKTETCDIADHAGGLREVARLLTDTEIGVIRDPSDIDAVGHRVVHGGESFAATIIITPEVKEEIKKLFPLAPLHNPPNLQGIEVSEKVFIKARQVAVFDTAFHHFHLLPIGLQSLPNFTTNTEYGLMAFMAPVINMFRIRLSGTWVNHFQKSSQFTWVMGAV